LCSASAPLVLRGHSKEVNSIAFGPGARRITTSSVDQTIKLWDAFTGEEVFTLRGHNGGVLSVAISPDRREIASTGMDTKARVWTAPRARAFTADRPDLADSSVSSMVCPLEGRW